MRDSPRIGACWIAVAEDTPAGITKSLPKLVAAIGSEPAELDGTQYSRRFQWGLWPRPLNLSILRTFPEGITLETQLLLRASGLL
jgi:hypothetical protein